MNLNEVSEFIYTRVCTRLSLTFVCLAGSLKEVIEGEIGWNLKGKE